MRGRTVRSAGWGAERVSGTHASNAALVLLLFVTVAGADGVAVLFDVFLHRARPDPDRPSFGMLLRKVADCDLRLPLARLLAAPPTFLLGGRLAFLLGGDNGSH